jgi:hypothetical protein
VAGGFETGSYQGMREVDLYSAPGCSHIPVASGETESESVAHVEGDESSIESSIKKLVCRRNLILFSKKLYLVGQ